MKIKASEMRIQYDSSMHIEIVIGGTKDYTMSDIDKVKDIVSDGKELSVEIKQYRYKRSLDSNAYMWLLLNKMAAILHTTKDELYIEVLSRYGVFTHVIVKENVVERVKAEWKSVRELGPVTIGGRVGAQLQCFFGSSTYDTKEMCTLIEGVVSEAKELGIETLPPYKLMIMKSEWGVK